MSIDTAAHTAITTAKMRPVKTWSPELRWESRDDGTIRVWRDDPLGPYPDRMGDRLIHWATVAPDRAWMRERGPDGVWSTTTYAQALAAVRALGQAILDLGLSGPDRPVMILSGNDTDHALLALAAQFVGVPSAAISPAYSLVSSDHAKLRDIVGQITPGLVYASDGAPFAPAIAACIPQDTPVVSRKNPARHGPSLADLQATSPTPAVDAAFAATGPDTIAKFLFTSGTTGSPKAVIQTQRMLCSNQEMVADSYAFLRDEPPVIVDWAPWNHTASGNKVFNMAIYHGGTYHIDAGKPSPAAIGETIRNLKEISPTWYFNVPAGYEMLVTAMETDTQLRDSFFARLNMLMYAGAGMAEHTWRGIEALAVQATGQRILLSTGLGSTETGPFALNCMAEQDTPGNVGIPAQGCELKLVPVDDKLEARVRGPHITPGYWRNPKLTAEAFDEEGFYLLGDALRFAVPGDPAQGFYFDGRIAENFKLRTGTWVAVGPLRAKLIDQLGGLARDAVLTAPDAEDLGAILIPFLPALRALVPDPAVTDEALPDHPTVRAELARRLGAHSLAATGSASRVVRAIWLDSAPSLDRGEITDKGSINQRAILRHRAALVAALYADEDPRVVRPDTGKATS
jgi:feruloyl-CoA synthase